MRKAIIFGANSDIARHLIIELSKNDYSFFLVSSSSEALIETVTLLEKCSVNILGTFAYDLSDPLYVLNSIIPTLNAASGFDLVALCQGTLGQAPCYTTTSQDITSIYDVNALSKIHIINEILIRFSAVNLTLVILSSVAGDRGRFSNHIYGSAYAALNTYIQGLLLHEKKIKAKIILCKLGLIDTKMTSHLKKSVLFSSPSYIAKLIMRLITHQKSGMFYMPSWWRFIMFAIKLLPGKILQQFKL